MKAEIFSIGTELLMGELTDTNSAWMAARLPALGIELQWVSIIGDNLAMLTEGFVRALQRADLICTTGGLGPTQDDLTREAIPRRCRKPRRCRRRHSKSSSAIFNSVAEACQPPILSRRI